MAEVVGRSRAGTAAGLYILPRPIAALLLHLPLLLLLSLLLLTSSLPTTYAQKGPAEYVAEPTWTQFQPTRYFASSRDAYIKISPDLRNGPRVPSQAQFGCSVSSLGDIDGNGMPDLVVGAFGESYYSAYNTSISYGAGAVYILLMTSNFTVMSHVRIGGDRDMINSPNIRPAIPLISNDNFGFSVANIGDIDGDGIVDIAVGAPGSYQGSVYIFFLNSDGTYKDSPIMLRGGVNGGPTQGYQGRLGSTVATIGDLDEDGIPDVIVTAGDAAAGNSKVHVLFMQRNGTVRSYSTIGFGIGGGPDGEDTFTNFGSSLLLMPDLDLDGIPDLVIGARFNQDPRGERNAGGLYICYMLRDGTIKSFVKHSDAMPVTIPTTEGIYLPFKASDSCGAGIAYIGDLNMDYMSQYIYSAASGLPSIPDLLVGCPATRSGFQGGRAMVLFLEGDEVGPTGQISGSWEISTYIPEDPVKDEDLIVEMPPLRPGDQFGQAVLVYVDFDSNGYFDYLISAPGDDSSYGNNTGALYLMTYKRIEYIPIPKDLTLFYVSITLFPALCCIITCSVCITLYFALQHREDQSEIIAKEVGVVKLGESVRKKRSSKRYDDDPSTSTSNARNVPVTHKILPIAATLVGIRGNKQEEEDGYYDDDVYEGNDVELGGFPSRNTSNNSTSTSNNRTSTSNDNGANDIEKQLALSAAAFRNRVKSITSSNNSSTSTGPDPRLSRPSVKLSHTPATTSSSGGGGGGGGDNRIHDFDGFSNSLNVTSPDKANTTATAEGATSTSTDNNADSAPINKRKSAYFTRGAKVEKKEKNSFAKQFAGKNRKLLKPKEITDFAPDDHVDYYF